MWHLHFWDILYYKVQQSNFIPKCDRLLLQSALGITKCDSYYQVRHNISSVTKLELHCEVLSVDAFFE